MANPLIRIHDLETNEIVDREMTDEEFASYQAILDENQSIIDAEAEKLQKRAALLESLGLTEDDAKLLLS